MTNRWEPRHTGRVRRIAVAAGVAALIWGALTALGTGLLLIGPALRSFDMDVIQDVPAMRSSELDVLTDVGSSMADTLTCIAIAVLAFVVLRLWLGRWTESWFVASAILGELLIFLAVTGSIERPRPPIEALDAAAPTSSFPSGHVGAAVALYGAIAVVLLLARPARPITSTLAVLLLLVPWIVALSRIYRGMHFPTDVLAGAIGGIAWLSVCIVLLLRRTGSGFDLPPGSGPASDAVADGSAVGIDNEVEHRSRPQSLAE